jgi:signal transduction histidine kinase
MQLVAETIALVRDVMTDLRPAVLDDYGLEAALNRIWHNSSPDITFLPNGQSPINLCRAWAPASK